MNKRKSIFFQLKTSIKLNLNESAIIITSTGLKLNTF
ncbi:hypothetical protein J2T04_003720 [Chryseobacterium lathyri]|uniref:Uncharacterized protein n=1 Tax=Chryseobacterium lathyri TaxID=395933 RepID=A0ABT9SQT8_9FLAO|nr:hypothetical protein [Chryseobacterium lathyri]